MAFSYENAILAEDAQALVAVLPAETKPALEALAAVIAHVAASLDAQEDGVGAEFAAHLCETVLALMTGPFWPIVVAAHRARAGLST